MTIEIRKPEDRRIIAGILVENGYKVSLEKVKIGTSKTATTVLNVEEK